MDYEQKHPISQEIYEYLKNTPKEQIDKDWSYILKETNPESYYEQKYKEALERARELLEDMDKGDYFASNGDIEYIFPDLKESEDERIRKELIELISCMHDADPRKKDWLAWLEKQGNPNTFEVPKTSIKDTEEVTSRMQHIKDDMKPIAEFIIDYANWNLHKDEWNQPTLTVPLFRVLDALIQRGKPYGECVQNIEKQDEQELAMKED